MIDGVKRAEVLLFSLSRFFFFSFSIPIQSQSEAAKAVEAVERHLAHTNYKNA